MSLLIPHWRCFETVSSGAEASLFSECCRYSLATLEVDCDPETKSFVLIEQQEPGIWRWALVNVLGLVLVDGHEPTQLGAKQAAMAALSEGPGC